MKLIIAVLVLGMVGCTVTKSVYLMGGQKDTNMDISTCWVQPPDNPLWYPCASEAVKDKECLNLMELAMKAVEADIKDGNKPKESTIKLWQRAKSTCWTEFKDLQEKHYH